MPYLAVSRLHLSKGKCVAAVYEEAAPKVAGAETAPTDHAGLIAWVEQIAAHTKPDAIRWCDGSDAEWNELSQRLVECGTLTPLDPAKRPNSFYARSDPRDVARVESRTFICSEEEKDAGPTNNWRAPAEMRALLDLGSKLTRCRSRNFRLRNFLALRDAKIAMQLARVLDRALDEIFCHHC